MKRVQLFEFEDLSWFPHWIRTCMTRLILVVHKMLNTDEEFSDLLAKHFNEFGTTQIIDLCSGSGGPMPNVIDLLETKHGINDIQLTLTDLYPDKASADKINVANPSVNYKLEPVDATDIPNNLSGIRTMIASFHHMEKEKAKKILSSAVQSRQPICIFEISDNGYPAILAWTAFPINIISCLFITPFVKSITWQQIVFTYLIPILPICFAWDGAVSNLRTYTLSDIDILLEGVDSKNYKWEKGIVKGKSKKIFLIGKPV